MLGASPASPAPGWVGPAAVLSSKDEQYRLMNRRGYSPWPKPCRARPGRAAVALGASPEQRDRTLWDGSPSLLSSRFSPQTLASPFYKQIPRTDSVGNEGVKQGCFQAVSLSNPPPPQQLSLPLCLQPALCCPSAERGQPLASRPGLPLPFLSSSSPDLPSGDVLWALASGTMTERLPGEGA